MLLNKTEKKLQNIYFIIDASHIQAYGNNLL